MSFRDRRLKRRARLLYRTIERLKARRAGLDGRIKERMDELEAVRREARERARRT